MKRVLCADCVGLLHLPEAPGAPYFTAKSLCLDFGSLLSLRVGLKEVSAEEFQFLSMHGREFLPWSAGTELRIFRRGQPQETRNPSASSSSLPSSLLASPTDFAEKTANGNHMTSGPFGNQSLSENRLPSTQTRNHMAREVAHFAMARRAL